MPRVHILGKTLSKGDKAWIEGSSEPIPSDMRDRQQNLARAKSDEAIWRARPGELSLLRPSRSSSDLQDEDLPGAAAHRLRARASLNQHETSR